MNIEVLWIKDGVTGGYFYFFCLVVSEWKGQLAAERLKVEGGGWRV